ncbi:MAG: CoA transferase [Proteobacteria bacterium]|nr:CoA transferase [Pseudomonadota bacterium]
MALRGGPAPAAGEVTITGSDPVYPTVFRIGDTAAAVLAGIGVAVNDLWESKTGRRQKVAVDTRHAAATMRTADFTYFRKPDGSYEPAPLDPVMQRMRQRTQPWPTKDGRWFLPHLNLPELSARVLGVLKCENTVEGVRDGVAKWNADDLEEAIARARACGGKVRTNAEWMAHPQGQYLAQRPLIEIGKIGESVPEPMPVSMTAGERPLTGIRVLDLTRILAGPVAARTLAEHGAEVLMVTAPHLPQTPEHVRDTSHGKRSCYLDLSKPDESAKLKELVRGADVFSQGYRPGVLAARGFGPEELAGVRPGIVYLTISCYGSGGPFADRAGWEQVAQTVTGICAANDGGTGRPALIHAAACDWITGYLGAYGVLLALAKRAREGGSYHVRVSLCQSGMFIQRQGRGVLDPSLKGLTRAEAEALQIAADSPYGAMRFLKPVVQMSETPPHWARVTPKLGADEPRWT